MISAILTWWSGTVFLFWLILYLRNAYKGRAPSIQDLLEGIIWLMIFGIGYLSSNCGA
jgi:hypothetical protein